MKKFIFSNFHKFLALFKFIYTVIFHKYCVFISGLQINRKLKSIGLSIPIKRLLLHDFSKFSYVEFWAYAQYYFGEKDQKSYEIAWLHHLKVNDHHWEHYVNDYKIGMDTEFCSKNAKEMKNEAILEMIADWFSAERAYKGNWPVPGLWMWAQKSIKDIGMHNNSKRKFLTILSLLGFHSDIKEVFILDDEMRKINLEYANLKNRQKFLTEMFDIKKNI